MFLEDDCNVCKFITSENLNEVSTTTLFLYNPMPSKNWYMTLIMKFKIIRDHWAFTRNFYFWHWILNYPSSLDFPSKVDMKTCWASFLEYNIVMECNDDEFLFNTALPTTQTTHLRLQSWNINIKEAGDTSHVSYEKTLINFYYISMLFAYSFWYKKRVFLIVVVSF